jgi:hypothetical protein
MTTESMSGATGETRHPEGITVNRQWNRRRLTIGGQVDLALRHALFQRLFGHPEGWSARMSQQIAGTSLCFTLRAYLA